MKTTVKPQSALSAAVAVALLGMYGGSAQAASSTAINGGQASLTVTCGSVNTCNATNTSWSLDNLGVQEQGIVLDNGSNVTQKGEAKWFVTATKGGGIPCLSRLQGVADGHK